MALSEDLKFEFIDVDGKQIKYECVENRVRKFIENEIQDNKITMFGFYKSSSQFMDYSDWNYHHTVTNYDPINTSKKLQKFCTKYKIKLMINGYIWSNKAAFCSNDDVELVFKCAKQLQSFNKDYANQYICNLCRGCCDVNIGSYHCSSCSTDVCPSCYLGVSNTRRCGSDIHHPNAFVMTVERMVKRVAFCNICLSRCNLDAVCYCCVPCIGYNFYALCIQCYTFGAILICQNGHPLSYYNKDELLNDGYSTTFECADCLQFNEIAYGAYHCSQCNFDLCPICYFKQKEENENKKEEKEEKKEEGKKMNNNICYHCCCPLNDETNASKHQQYDDDIIYESFCKACFELIKYLFSKGSQDQGIQAIHNRFRVNKALEFKDKYIEFMPPIHYSISRSRAKTWINYNRIGWTFNETLSSRSKDHLCFIKIKIFKLTMDENFETENAICTANIKLTYYWLFDKADYELFRGKRVDCENKRKWTKFEPGRPWEPIIEFVAPSTGTQNQNIEDIEFSIIAVNDFFGDDLLMKDSKELFAKSVGYLRSIQHEFEVSVEEPFELESYPFDSQEIPITIAATNFSRFSPALDFAQNGNNEPVIMLDGDTVSFGDWNVSGVLAEFPTINNQNNEMKDFEMNEMSIRIKIQRKWKLALTRKGFVICCVTLLSLTTFVFEIDDAATKLSIVAGLILVLIFLDLPQIPIFSLLDWYFYSSFGFLVAMAAQSAIADRFTEDQYNILLLVFIGTFIVYHIVFFVVSIKTLWKEHRKIFMNAQTAEQSVEMRTKSLDIYSTLQTENDMLNYVFNGINGLFTQLPAFCCGKRGGLTKLEQPGYKSVEVELAEIHEEETLNQTR